MKLTNWKQRTIKIVIVLSTMVFIFCTGFNITYSFREWYDEMRIEEEEKVIRWYIDNDKPPYDMYDSYEEYLEELGNNP